MVQTKDMEFGSNIMIGYWNKKSPPRRQKLGTAALYKTKKSVEAIKINNI